MRLWLLLLIAGWATSSQAGLTFYSNQLAFNNATAGMFFETETFEGYAAGLLGDDIEHAFNGFTAKSVETAGAGGGALGSTAFYVSPGFSAAGLSPFTTSTHLGWTEEIDTPLVKLTGDADFGPSVTLKFNQPVNAASFLFLDNDQSDQYELSIDGTNIGSQFPNGLAKKVLFFGIVDDTGTFSELTFTPETSGAGGFVDTFGIDNVSFSSNVTVPEPTTALSFLAITTSVCLYRRRRV
ncbi:PEP-CTERM sorting domain-containing protein [Stieleria sp. JC731]|uniref:PEP-CTERM sorting domain-containing protein n=1 Tax=Pirellulaceae TaxID=2691357 RepID=UPI001E594CAA|nr:PEP-CTERM sorting domain-containing protein [Stieleria sp. JC731]MCC9599638.1 PEP-CTERM sorting domain-containing protein [Stieleria sp. JC731]